MTEIITRRTRIYVYLLVLVAVMLIGALFIMQLDLLSEITDEHLRRDFIINLVFSGGLLLLAISGVVVFRNITRQRKVDAAARRQAEESLKLYLRALEASTSGVLLLDARKPTFPILYANPAFERMTGYALAEVLGKDWDVLVDVANAQSAHSHLQQALRQSTNATVELPSRRKDGSILWNEINLAPVLDDAGAITHFVAILNDLTLRRATEESLRQSQQFVTRINDLIPDYVYVLDLATQQTMYHNAVFNTVRSAWPDEAQNGDWDALLALTHPEDAGRVVQRFPALYQAADNEVIETEYRMRHRDGSWHWYRDREAVFERDAQGNPSHVIGISTNITPHKEINNSLRQSQQFVKRINDLVPDCIYILDYVQQRTIYQNRAMSAVLGYTESDVMEDGWDIRLANIHPDDREAHLENLNRFLQVSEDTIIESEQRIRHKDGSWRWFMVRETVFDRSDDGSPRQIIGVAADITERKRTEEALRAREEQYRELYTASHRHTQELSLLNKVRTALLSEIDFSTLIRVIVEGVAEAFGYNLVSIYMLNGDILKLHDQVGYDQIMPEIPITRGVLGRVVRTRQPVWLEDVSSDPDFVSATPGIVSKIAVPLFDNEAVVGVLNVETRGDIEIGESDLRLMTALSEQLSIAIGRARLYQDLQESEERYRVVSELVSDYAYSFDVMPDGTFVHDWITDSYTRLTGYSLEEAAANTSTTLLFHPDEQQRVKRDVELTVAGQETSSDYQILTKDKQERWLHIRRRPVWDEQEKRVVKIYGVAQDITITKLAELQLQSYAQEVEDLYNEAPCAYHSLGDDGIFIRINDTGLKWLGYEREELIGQLGFSDLLTTQGQATCHEAFVRLQESGHVADLEFEVRRKDGTYFTVLLSATAVYDEQGKFVMSRASMFDITDRKSMERAEQEQRTLTEGFREVAIRLSQTLDLDEVLDLVLSTVRRVVPHNSASVMLIENQHGRIVRYFGFTDEEIENAIQGESFKQDDLETVRQIVATRQPLIIGDTESFAGWRTLVSGTGQTRRSYLGVPISLEDEVVGIIHLTSSEKNFFALRHAERLSILATQAAVAIQNARLYKQAQEFAMLEERQRLARDLHDAVSQTLFSASVVAETLPRIWERQTPEDTKRGLNELMRLTRGALAEMRNLLAELRPKALTETDFGVLLKQLTDATGGHIQIPIKLEVAADTRTLPPDTQIAFYRVAQEAFSNIIKHARARQLEVKYTYKEGNACLQIKDDGRGFDLGQLDSGHYGLQIMRERATSAGANLTVVSQPGEGTQITMAWHAHVEEPA